MFLVMTPCASVDVESISLKYAPPGSAREDSGSDPVVLGYRVLKAVSPSDLLVPLMEGSKGVEGLEETVRDDELLAEAMKSTWSPRFDDYFYVEVVGRLADGSETRFGGTWAASMSHPDSVVLGAETFDDPASLHCGIGAQRGWNLPLQS